MTDQLRPEAHSSNGVLHPPTPFAPAEESKKDKKKRKKKEKQERRALLGGFYAPEDATVGLETWLRPVSRTLDTQRILTAHKSSFLIAINCLMLSIAAHALYRGLDAGPLQWAMVPLALTNVLSLTFGILSAQVHPSRTALDELWAMPEDEYTPAVASMLQDKQRVYGNLSSAVHELGADLNQRQRHLRTAYSVLLGGVALSTCVFALCVAVGNRGA